MLPEDTIYARGGEEDLSEDDIAILEDVMLGTSGFLLSRAAAARTRVAASPAAAARLLEQVPRLLAVVLVGPTVAVDHAGGAVRPGAAGSDGAGRRTAGALAPARGG